MANSWSRCYNVFRKLYLSIYHSTDKKQLNIINISTTQLNESTEPAFTFKVLTDTDSLNACIRIEAHPRYVYNTDQQISDSNFIKNRLYLIYSIG